MESCWYSIKSIIITTDRRCSATGYSSWLQRSRIEIIAQTSNSNSQQYWKMVVTQTLPIPCHLLGHFQITVYTNSYPDIHWYWRNDSIRWKCKRFGWMFINIFAPAWKTCHKVPKTSFGKVIFTRCYLPSCINLWTLELKWSISQEIGNCCQTGQIHRIPEHSRWNATCRACQKGLGSFLIFWAFRQTWEAQ